MNRVCVAGAVLAPLLLGAAPPPAATLVVEVSNVGAARGLVHVDICPEAQFLKDNCPYAADVPARAGVTAVPVRGVPPGRYAAQAYWDANANHQVDRGLFGIPKEGVGFSNDAPIHLSPPKFAAAAFTMGTAPEVIRLKLRYFLGQGGAG